MTINTESGRDEAAKSAYSKLNVKGGCDWLSYDLGFKSGWDARDEQLLKLHGEGAMADVIRLQQEVNRLKRSLVEFALAESAHVEEVKRLRDAAQNLLNHLPDRVLSDNAMHVVELQRLLAEQVRGQE